VAQLREAGAVILGKANLSEWANFRGNNSYNGWSARGGFTRCPYLLSNDPLGSSSGSAVAAAASLCSVAVGTETDGSIMAPSDHKPCFRAETHGRSDFRDGNHSHRAQPGHSGAHYEDRY